MLTRSTVIYMIRTLGRNEIKNDKCSCHLRVSHFNQGIRICTHALIQTIHNGAQQIIVVLLCATESLLHCQWSSCTSSCCYITNSVIKRLLGFWKETCLPYNLYADLSEFLYANECSSAQAHRFSLCIIYQRVLFTAMINTNAHVHTGGSYAQFFNCCMP